ncbi:MAG: SMP-30/gluconolactonase/LRE family protein [Spirochaetales bacterium]|nr:SMP-30/gluconolactonase/LRE family protein [Spirochaetales bacterium]
MKIHQRTYAASAAGRILLAVLSMLTAGTVYAETGITVLNGIPGPEDIVIDNYHDFPRLLVSSTDRRYGAVAGEIYEVVIDTGLIRPLKRTGEPEGLVFNPHGLDIVEEEKGRILLYVITHWENNEGEKHAVVRYRVFPDRLFFERLYSDDLLASPNDLAALPDGTIYVSNDSSAGGGMFEMALGLKRSSVVYFNGEAWSVAAGKIAMANGIEAFPGVVYVSATRENRVYAFDRRTSGELTEKRVLARIKGPDNISVWGEYLIVAGHAKTIALARHLSASGNPPPSPTAIHSINRRTGETRLEFSDAGNIISAGSVGVVFDGHLYVGQIMDPFVVSLRLE